MFCKTPKKSGTKEESISTVMTVIRIMNSDTLEAYNSVIFKKSARIYKLPKDSNPLFVKRLNNSQKNDTPIIIKRKNEQSDVILAVEDVK